MPNEIKKILVRMPEIMEKKLKIAGAWEKRPLNEQIIPCLR